MIYCIESLKTGEKIWIQSKKNYTKKEIEKIINVIKFDLSHHVNTDDILTILCNQYGFEIISNILV